VSACIELLSHLVGSASIESIGPGHDGGKNPEILMGMELAAGLSGLDEFLCDFAQAIYMRDPMAQRSVELELRRRFPKLDKRVIQAAWAAYMHPLPVDESGRTFAKSSVGRMESGAAGKTDTVMCWRACIEPMSPCAGISATRSGEVSTAALMRGRKTLSRESERR
jgi:hypothetical protein